jgi:hypothetical protein
MKLKLEIGENFPKDPLVFEFRFVASARESFLFAAFSISKGLNLIREIGFNTDRGSAINYFYSITEGDIPF